MSTDHDINEVTRIFLLQNEKNNLQALKNTSATERIIKIKRIEKYLLDPANHKEISKALWQDLRKPDEEVIATEISAVILNVKSVSKNLKSWMQDEYVPSPLTMAGMTSYIKHEPKGNVLIISPWNYPLQLTLNPVISAIAAGNAVTIKPSEISSNTSKAIKKMINHLFDESEIAVIEGSVNIASALLEKPFNHIHFTGSPAVGKIVMHTAAKNLTSVTLELGGKSPVVVDETVNIESVAQKIAWAKCLNNGQTCIAPDYALIHERKVQDFINAFEGSVEKFYNSGEKGIQNSPDYCRIINTKNHIRIVKLIEDAVNNGAKKVIGKEYDENDKFIPPTVLINVDHTMSIMQEEIFGPVLPIITFKEIDEVSDIIYKLHTPLALYIMSNSRKNTNYILNNTSAGGTAINELMVTSINPNLPFGGMNNSGIGRSNGKFGFVDFSNERGIVKRNWGNLKIIYPPYNAKVFKFFKTIVRL